MGRQAALWQASRAECTDAHAESEHATQPALLHCPSVQALSQQLLALDQSLRCVRPLAVGLCMRHADEGGCSAHGRCSGRCALFT